MAIKTSAAVLSIGLLVATPGWSQPAVGTSESDWDLTVIYKDGTAAENDRVATEAELATLAPFKGHLGDNADTLQAALERRSQLLRRVRRLYLYSFLKVSEDARVASAQAFRAATSGLVAEYREDSAFFDPEIVAIGRTRLAAFETADPGLTPYRRPIELVMRRADHVLSPATESAIGASSALMRAPLSTHDILTDSEIPWPTIPVHGVQTKIDRAMVRNAMHDPDRATRRAVFEAYTSTLGQFKNTQAALLQAHVAGAAYEAKLRHYPSSAAFLLANDAMPLDAFQAMSRAAEDEQPAIDRYLKLRARALGIDKVHSYDFAVPLSETTVRYPLADGEALVLKALDPLGPDYVARLAAGFGAHRMHSQPAPGKSSAAMTIPFNDGIPPMVMISYTGDAESVLILAHEWGHAMHMDMSAASQPYESANPSVFVGDTPSLLNEMLVNDYMVSNASNSQERIAALSEAIETLRRTYYQVLPTMRLEMLERAAADSGKPLTADRISEMSCDELRRFNGADRGVSVVEPGACLTWTVSQEPYDDLYFYKYLNAVSAAAFFADQIERHVSGALDRYFALLRAGSSNDPYLLLKAAGFDAMDPAAYAPMGRRFENDVAQLEHELRLVGKVNAAGVAKP